MRQTLFFTHQIATGGLCSALTINMKLLVWPPASKSPITFMRKSDIGTCHQIIRREAMKEKICLCFDEVYLGSGANIGDINGKIG